MHTLYDSDGLVNWHKIFAILPVTTLKGERIWGNCYRKFIAYEHGMKPIYLNTKKAVFCDKLGA